MLTLFATEIVQVEMHVPRKHPKETPQEKMADVVAVAEVTKEETDGIG